MVLMKTAFILASLLLASPVAAATFPPLNNKPVVDAANIIPDDREAALMQRLYDIKKQSGHEVAVVTVPDLEGAEIEEYALDAFNSYGLGTRDGDDGVLFIIAPNEHRDRIEVGDGLQGLLTDGETSRINDGMVVPMFKDGDYPGGIELGVEEIAKVITPLTPAQLMVKQRADAQAASRRAATMATFKDGLMVIGGILAGIAAMFGLVKLATLPKRRRLERERLARVAAEAKRREEQRVENARLAAIAREEQLEQDRLDAIETERRRKEHERRETERRRIAEEARLAQVEKERVERVNMLAAMTPVAREAFLQKERDDAERERLAEIERRRQAEIKRQQQAVIDAERQRQQAIRDAERRREEDRQREQQRRDDDAAASRRRSEEAAAAAASASTWSSPSPSPSPSPSIDFGGGGGTASGGGDSGSW
jgi:uncharacterized protein